MSKGTPHMLKCPACKRGKWGHGSRSKGCQANKDERRLRWCGRYRRWQCRAYCLDCGHKWWTSLFHLQLWGEEMRKKYPDDGSTTIEGT